MARAADPPLNDTALLLQELIRIDTSNPPGNEAKMAAFLKTKFAPLGFEIDIIPTPDPAKAHFIARLRGDGSKKPVLVASHADVVGVEREKWSLDPFAGVVKDGYIYGRGAIDFKGGIAVFAEAVLRIAKEKKKLARDIIFLSESDEEGGKYNTSTYNLEAITDQDSRITEVQIPVSEDLDQATPLSFNANLAPARRYASIGHQWLLRGKLDNARPASRLPSHTARLKSPRSNSRAPMLWRESWTKPATASNPSSPRARITSRLWPRFVHRSASAGLHRRG